MRYYWSESFWVLLWFFGTQFILSNEDQENRMKNCGNSLSVEKKQGDVIFVTKIKFFTASLTQILFCSKLKKLFLIQVLNGSIKVIRRPTTNMIWASIYEYCNAGPDSTLPSLELMIKRLRGITDPQRPATMLEIWLSSDLNYENPTFWVNGQWINWFFEQFVLQ